MVTRKKKLKVIGLIPARLQSTRLPEKALVDICGLPMVVHTYLRSCYAELLDDVFVVTDSPRIRDAVLACGGKVILSKREHDCGTNRIAEAAEDMDCDIVVNIQGDEPLVKPKHIDAIIRPLLEDESIQVSVGVTPYKKKNSRSDIKAVLDLRGDILYCSRNDLPSDARTPVDTLLKMCFIVPCRKDFLLQYAKWEPTPLEKVEFIEHLRILEHGVKMRAVHLDHAHISVDMPEELEEVRKLMAKDVLFEKYIHKKTNNLVI
jgi:3-deoxy-manno-octulosonate cytidylyltransferase (CMP-KDO synthetase)